MEHLTATPVAAEENNESARDVLVANHTTLATAFKQAIQHCWTSFATTVGRLTVNEERARRQLLGALTFTDDIQSLEQHYIESKAFISCCMQHYAAVIYQHIQQQSQQLYIVVHPLIHKVFSAETFELVQASLTEVLRFIHNHAELDLPNHRKHDEIYIHNQ
jgi:hypothetical protein